MEIKEYSPIGLEAIEGKHALIVGISINNSYFKIENLEKLLAWSSSSAETVYIMIPDEPTVHTLMALGRTREEAERIARLKSNALENKCKEICQRFDLPRVKIIRWKNIAANEYYQAALAEIDGAYITDTAFHNAIREVTVSVLINGSSLQPTLEAIETGVQFLLKELAFITRADRILEEDTIAYVYHKTMGVLKETIDGRYAFRASRGVGFITAE